VRSRFVFIFLLLTAQLRAQDDKLELGLGLGSLYYPNYVGSKDYQFLTLPIPYIRYTGKYFRIDEDGLSQDLVGIKGLKLEASVSGSLPASSEKNDARESMPNLDLTGEVGFKLVYNLFEKNISKLELEMPLRVVLSTNFTNLHYQGIVSNPQIKYSLDYDKLEWTFRTGILLANKRYNSYYYSVDKIYETPSRAAYDANGGFSGFKSRVGVTYRHKNWWSGASVSYYNISNATFSDSPLVQTHHSLYTGIALAYIFYTKP